MDLQLSDRVVLVTGGNKGIGRAIAEFFGKEGARTAITYRHSLSQAEQVVEGIRKAGAKAMLSYMDLGEIGSIESAVYAVHKEWGRLDVLVHNAVATEIDAAGGQGQIADWQALLRINVEGSYALVQTVLPLLKQNSWGRIVIISSALAVDGIAKLAWYGSAKSAMHGMARSLFREFGPAGILINVVMPGLVLTEREVRRSGHLYAQPSPLSSKRRLLMPDEIAPLVAFLGSPANTAVNGEIIRAIGG